MSQHLISQFINRSYVFKPFNGARLANHKVKAYESSNRENNNSPEDIAESTHPLQKIKIHPKEDKQNEESESTIDITV